MAAFDAEYYLRRHAEHDLVDDQQDEQRSMERARALVALDLLPAARARAILSGYARARALRTAGFVHDGFDEDDDEDSSELGYARVCALGRTVHTADGAVTLRWVALGPTRVAVAVRITFGTQGPRHPMHRHGKLAVTDDRGTVANLDFSGGGDQTRWTGRFTGAHALALDTAWLEISGERVELPEYDPGVTVTAGRLHLSDPRARAARLLEDCLERATEHHHGADALSEVLDVVVASGLLPADAPEAGTARAVHEAITTGQVVDARALPEHWQSVLAPPRRRRPATGEIAIGADVRVDGLTLTLLALAGHRDHLELELDGRGRQPDQLMTHDHRPPVTFTATDDVGHHYVGRTNEWHSGSEGFGGTVRFEPALDAAAARLDLAFTTSRARAVASLPLRWGATS